MKSIKKALSQGFENMTMDIAKTFKKTRTSTIIIFILLNVCFMFMAGGFLKDVGEYVLANDWIRLVENDAAVGTWTADGYVHWTERLTAEGQEAKLHKEQLIETNDVARWCYYSGFSQTGKMLRAFCIVTVIVFIIYFVYCDVIAVLCVYYRVEAKKCKKRKKFQ